MSFHCSMGRLERAVQLIAVCALFFGGLSAHAGSLRVSPEWLKEQLSRQDLVLLDTRPRGDYEAGHIPGALNLPDTLTYQQKSAGGRIAELGTMQTLLRERGIDQNTPVIVYDAGTLLDAARVFWALEVYGLRNVKLLSPGFGDWSMKGYPVSTESPKVVASEYVPTIDHRRIASKFSTQLAMADPQRVVVDARFPKSYRGETSTAKRHGHIPTAINIPVTSNLKKENDIAALLGADELRSVYAPLPQSKKIVLYCEIGRASATSYLALRELGYDVANYDASWREWGNDLSLPIEK